MICPPESKEAGDQKRYSDKGECVMYSEIKEQPEDQGARKIIAQHLVKNYTLKEKNGLFSRKSKKLVHAVRDISLEIPRGKIIGD